MTHTHMRRKMIRFALLMLSLSPMARITAQQTYVPTETGCVQAFYDRDYYNWLSYRNTCSESMYVEWISRVPGLNGGSVIRAGSKENTGWSAQEISAKGGMEVYVCPEHYLPVDPRGNPLTRQVTLYACKYQGY